MKFILKKQVIGPLVFFSLLNILSAQELVKNGNFEQCSSHPVSWGQAHLVNHWKSFSNKPWSPVTYFYDFEGRSYIPTMREGGKQEPYSGYGFMGLGIAFRKIEKKGSQILETELLMPLEKDSIYIISAYVSIADKVRYAIDYIPVLLSSQEIIPPKNQPFYTASKVIQLRATTPFLNDAKQWMHITAEYKAKGGERFLLIGGIVDRKKDKKPDFRLQKMPFRFSFNYLILNKLTFYFIDQLSLKKMYDSNTNHQTVPLVDSVKKLSNKIVLSDVLFDSNSWILKDSFNNQLNALISQLLTNKQYTIAINGYTDNSGKQEWNTELSERRAKAIYSYLNQQGITENRMTYQGYGERTPVADNTTVEGRSRNRRVEIIINE